MKKIISLVICIAMMLSSVSTMAKEGELIVNTVKVNINEGSVTLNDEWLSVSGAPYVNENGDTMIDMYALVNALGGEIAETDGVYLVTYEGVEIKYTLNSAEVNVAGQTLVMNSAVVTSDDGTVMAPLRFVSEALGADVTYNGETGEIVIVSAGALDEAVNYKLLFKYMEKNKIGHSKEHWRFTKTDNFDMADSTYGRTYEFAMDDIMFTLQCLKNTDSNSLEQYYIEMQKRDSYYSRYVMYDKGKAEHNGVPYAYTKHRTLDTIIESYVYETDEFFYCIDIQRTFENFAGSEENPDVKAFLNSLEFDYKGGDEENTVDIATIDISKDVSKEAKEEYVDGNYNWSIKLNDTWEVDEYYGFYNKVTIHRPTGVEDEEAIEDEYAYMYGDYSSVMDPVITVTTYSNPENQTVQQWVEKKQNVYKNTLNMEECQVSDIEDIKLGTHNAKCFEVVYSSGEETFAEKRYYLNNGKYRYEIALSYDKREEDVKGFKESADALIASFKAGEIDENEVGDALEADNDVEMLSVLTKFEGDIFTISYPCTWRVSETNKGIRLSRNSTYYSGSYMETQLSLMLSSANALNLQAQKLSLSYYDDDLNKKTYTLEEYMNKSLASMLNTSSSYMTVSMPSGIKETTLLGKKGYKAELVLEEEGEDKSYYTVYYIPYDKENVITVTKICNGQLKNTVYEAALEKALNSLKIS